MMSRENQRKSIPAGSGCISAGLFIAVIFWMVGSVVLLRLTDWFFEQMVFEGSAGFPDLRWLFTLLLAVGVLIPNTILWAFIKAPRFRSIFRIWALAGLYILLLTPARFFSLTDSLGASIAHVAGSLIFLIVLLVWRFRTQKETRSLGISFEGMGLGLLAVGVTAIPWMIIGALGSPVDLAANFVTGIVLGAAASILLTTGLPKRPEEQNGSGHVGKLLFDGLVVSITLLLFANGVAQNGNQWVIIPFLPVAGWIFVVVSRTKAVHRASNWVSGAVLIGGLAANSLIWLDSDELMMVTGLGKGELIGWASLTVFLALALGILISAVYIAIDRTIRQTTKLTLVVNLTAGVTWLIVLGLYFLVGQPGFHGEKLFVVMSSQADLSALTFEKGDDYWVHRKAVYQTLTAHAEETQADLRAELESKKIPFVPYYLVNGIEVDAGPLTRRWLKNHPDVGRVLDNPVLRPLPAPVAEAEGEYLLSEQDDWNLHLINADQVWKELNITGKGIIVGQSDSGVQGDHPELLDGYRGGSSENDYHWFDPWNGSTSPVDIGGHGTHTLGSVLGNQVGVAPDAEWIGCVNLARNLGNPALYLDCMQFMLAPFPQNGNPFTEGKPELGAHVLNNSWGCPDVEGCDPEIFAPAVKALRTAGLFIVVSAGNSGYSGCGSVESPLAIYDEVYSIGAVNRSGFRVDFSSMGPVVVDGSSRIKPDIAAPGEGVFSAYPGSTYEIASGTSMAGPHVVGVVALMWSANSDLIGDINATEMILNDTATLYDGPVPDCVDVDNTPNNAVGFGIVNAFEAVKMAINYEK
jgi:hypothetical protein